MACEQVTLQDVCELIVDCPHTSAKDEGVGYPLIRTPNVGRGRLILTDVHRVSQDVYERRVSRAVPRQGDLILAREAPAGNVAIVSPGIEVCLGQRTMLLRPDSSFVVPEYLNYYLNAPEQRDRMLRLANGATVSHINVADIRNMPVQLPSRGEQSKVAELLNVLDDKIDLNNRLNDYLLELATVRFEQELAKESKTYRFSELIELEDSKRVPLNSRDRKVRKGSYPYYGATSIMDYVDDYLFDGIRVLLGEDGTVIREDGKPVLQYVWGKYWVNNHAHILKSKVDYSLEAIYIALARTTINHIVTGAVQMKISQKNLNDLELEMPTASSLDYLEDIFALYRSNAEESKKLEILRDVLLPKLLSGKIDVSKVDLTQLTNNHLSGCGSFCSVCCPSGLASEFHEWFREHFFFGYGHLCKADLGWEDLP